MLGNGSDKLFSRVNHKVFSNFPFCKGANGFLIFLMVDQGKTIRQSRKISSRNEKASKLVYARDLTKNRSGNSSTVSKSENLIGPETSTG